MKLFKWSSLLLIVLLGFGLIGGCSSTSSTDSTSGGLGTNIVTGTVTNPSGAAASSISVYTYVAAAGLGKLTTEAAAGTLIQTTTAANGLYSLTGFYPGRSYILIAYSSTYGLTYHSIVTSATIGNTTVANFQLSDNSGGGSGATAPTVTITDPDSDVTVAGSTYTITGTVDDDTISEVVIDVNGSQANVSVTSGSFSYTVILRNGANTITVRASNAEGTGTATVTITSQAATMAIKATLTWDQGVASRNIYTGRVDMDLHMWKYNSGSYTKAWHCYFGDKTITEEPAQNLDVDNTWGYGPENLRITSASANATYKIGVAYWSGAASTNCVLRLSLNEGTNAAVVYTYGPYNLTQSGSGSSYSSGSSTAKWWRPIDVQINANGVASIITATDTNYTFKQGYETEAVSK
ncbi:hypothetical protein ACFL57_01435 [Candidatus Margulisiibacteriota bacterium]